jgi:lipoate-protein ligase A
MKLLELTLETPEENLALDEALLDVAETSEEAGEVLRLWESPRHVVVLGRSSDAQAEVNLDACRKRGIPVLRRTSGGATVLIGPGCLMYAVVLSYERRSQLRMIEMAHRFVLERLRQAIEPQLTGIDPQGTSDLTLNLRKFSGNSLKCRQRHLLYHGTIIYDFSTALMSECLAAPARQPDYRHGRKHQDFVSNIDIDPALLRSDLAHVWDATQVLIDWPSAETARVVAERYSQPKWRLSDD